MSDTISRLDAIEARLKAATPEIYNACAHPQAVWFECHWRPLLDAKSDDLAFTVQALREALAALDKCKAKIGEDVYVIATRADVIATETLDRIARLAGE